jgi:hypothetical protein
MLSFYGDDGKHLDWRGDALLRQTLERLLRSAIPLAIFEPMPWVSHGDMLPEVMGELLDKLPTQVTIDQTANKLTAHFMHLPGLSSNDGSRLFILRTLVIFGCLTANLLRDGYDPQSILGHLGPRLQ